MMNKFLWNLVTFIVVVCLGWIGILWLFYFYSQNAIDRAYYTLSESQIEQMSHQLSQFQLPQQYLAALGLEVNLGGKPTLQAANAFAAGVWSGQQELLGHPSAILPATLSPPSPKPAWQETGWKNDFELGRWILLLWAITHSSIEMPLSFWQQQQQILKNFQTQFIILVQKKKDREAQIVVSALDLLLPLLNALAQQPTVSVAHLLEKELAFLIDSLSP